MMDYSIINWYGTTDDAILGMLGEYIRTTRLDQNKTQHEIAAAAGINRSTLSQLEKGTGATLNTFIQVLRVLNQLQTLEAFKLQKKISPLLVAEQQQSLRKRARNKPGSDQKPISNW